MLYTQLQKNECENAIKAYIQVNQGAPRWQIMAHFNPIKTNLISMSLRTLLRKEWIKEIPGPRGAAMHAQYYFAEVATGAMSITFPDHRLKTHLDSAMQALAAIPAPR